MSVSELDQLIEEQHVALDTFVKGNDEPLAKLWSRTDDVTLGNPFGPFARGFGDVAETLKAAAAFYSDGEATGFELLSKHVTAELAYIVEVERFTARFVGRDDFVPLSLRCTSIFRREDGRWRLVHRHADPITTARTPESLIQK